MDCMKAALTGSIRVSIALQEHEERQNRNLPYAERIIADVGTVEWDIHTISARDRNLIINSLASADLLKAFPTD